MLSGTKLSGHCLNIVKIKGYSYGAGERQQFSAPAEFIRRLFPQCSAEPNCQVIA